MEELPGVGQELAHLQVGLQLVELLDLRRVRVKAESGRELSDSDGSRQRQHSKLHNVDLCKILSLAFYRFDTFIKQRSLWNGFHSNSFELYRLNAP